MRTVTWRSSWAEGAKDWRDTATTLSAGRRFVGGQALGYDGKFNLKTMAGLSADYDAMNRLTSANGNSAQFVYDGLGRCVKRTINGTAKLVVYDNWNPILEFDGAGNATHWNLYGTRPDEIVMRSQNWYNHLWYHHDSHGNVVALLDDGGNIVEKYRYDAFGRPTILSANNTQLSTSAVSNRFLFQGREWIPELGIYDYRHRYYHPGLGRFLQTDPIGFKAGDMNLFRYCGDDPVDLTDPMGLESGPVPIARPNLTAFGKGDWVFDQRNISYWDEMQHRQPAGNIMLGLVEKNDSARNEGAPRAQVSNKSRLLPWLAPVRVTGSSFAERQRIRHELRRVLSTPRGQELVAIIKQQGLQRVIRLIDNWNNAQSDTPGRLIRMDPRFHPPIITTVGTIEASTARIIGHELGHAVTGAGWNEVPGNAMDNVIQNENPIANSLGEPSRIQY